MIKQLLRLVFKKMRSSDRKENIAPKRGNKFPALGKIVDDIPFGGCKALYPSYNT